MKIHQLIRLILLVPVSLLFVMPVNAQSSLSNGAEVIEEVLVTARRRSETALESPLAVTAFNAQMIEDAGIQRVEDFVALTPNVTMATSQGIGTSFLSIRGVTQVRNGESPVATVVDGVLQFSAIQFRRELFDVESIEVVKGPQGAIYGRNATGGAIIINTRRPTNEKYGYVQVGAGDGEEYSVQGSFGGPIVEDRWYGQLSANFLDREGYLDNITRGEEADRFEDTTIRGRLIFEPSDAFSADFRVAVSKHKGRGIGFQFQGVNIAPDGITATGFGTDTGPIDANNVLPVRDNNVDTGERDMLDFTLKLDWETSFGNIVSTSSFTDIEEWGDSDQFPYTNARSSAALFGFDGTQTGFFELSAFTQELRLSSLSDSNIQWEVGAYYLDWERFVSLSTGTDTGQGIIRLEREPTTNARNPTTSFLADDNNNSAWAVFGSVDFDLTDQLDLLLALRYDDEDREQKVSPLQFPAGVPGARNTASFSKLQPKVTFRYQPSDDMNLYLTWGEGFRSGQFNQNGISVVAAGAGLVGVTDLVRQEESESIELGFKGRFADGRLRLNAAIFSTDVENQQFFSFIGAISAQILTSIPEVSLSGVEVDVVFQATENLSLFAAYGITNSEIDAYPTNPAAVGNDAPYIAENTANVGLQYRAAISDNLQIFARADYERRGEQFWDVDNSTARDALELVNARIGIESSDGKWSVTGAVYNLTDEIYNSEWVAGGFSAAAPGRIWNVMYRHNFF
ncbi:MAG: TonB-dependent receptor [Gammaproteobacteria bacterium]|nr:TonB-dependent receptor [Gammaproteobacteria bacterium]